MSKTTKTPPISHFKLCRLKKDEDGSLNIKHLIKTTDNGQVNWITHESSYPFIAAPQLSDRLHELCEALFKSTGFRDFEVILNSKENLSAKEIEAAKAIAPILKRHLSSQLDHIRITGFTITEDEEKGADSRKVLITGVRTWSTGSAALNSPLITLSGTHFGVEPELSELIEEIIDEVYAYIYEGKRSQLEVFPPKEKDPDLFSSEEEAVIHESANQLEGISKPEKKKAPEPAKKKKKSKLATQTEGKKKKKK